MPKPASAAVFYTEVQTGLNQFATSDSLVQSTGASVKRGASLGLGLYYSLSGGSQAADLQFGLVARLNNGSQYPGNNLSLFTPAAVVRIQLSRLFFGGGVAPLVWRRVDPSAGINHLDRVTSVISYYGEAGILWPVTSDFSLGLGADLQQNIGTGAAGSKLSYRAGALMRFYFSIGGGTGASGSGSKGSNEYQGWRYPFGFIK